MPRLKYALNGGRFSDQRLDADQWRKLAARSAAHGDDAVVIGAAAAREQIFPPELLYRGVFGGELEALVLIREARERRQDFILAFPVDLVDRKAKTAVEMAIKRPSDKGDVVIGKCDRRHNPGYKSQTLIARNKSSNLPQK